MHIPLCSADTVFGTDGHYYSCFKIYEFSTILGVIVSSEGSVIYFHCCSSCLTDSLPPNLQLLVLHFV